MASNPLDGLLPIRQILVDGEPTPFLRDLDFQSTGFSVTVDEANGKLVVDGTSTFGDGFVVNDENSNVALRVLNGITDVQGDVVNIATELNTTINVGNGADTLNVATNDINLGADNVLSLAAPTVRLGGAAASDRLTISGATSIITADVPDNTIFNLRTDTFGIYEAAQPFPSFTFSCDADAASSLTFGASTTVTISQSQSLSGAGRTLTIAGQQGQAGQVGGDLILKAGRGGTPGTNVNGNVRVKLGTPVSNATGVFYLEREDGTLIMSTYEIAAGIVGMYFGSAGGSSQGIIRGASVGLESSSSLVSLQPATDLYIGHASNRDIFHRESATLVLTEHLDADGQTRFRFADGPTSILFDQTAKAASGVGADWTIQAQQGNANAGGKLILKSGPGGTPGTHAGGEIVVDSGAAITGSTAAKVSFQAGGTEYLYIQRNAGGGSIGLYNNVDSSVFYAASVVSILSGGNEAWLGGWLGTRVYTGQADQPIYMDWSSGAGQHQSRSYHKTTTTTNATPVNVTLYTPANDRAFMVHCNILGYNDAGDKFYSNFTVTSGRREAGAVTMATANKVHENTDLAASAAVTGSAGNVIVTLTGVAATNIRWEIYTTVFLCGTFA